MYTHSVSLDVSKCVGCTNCIKSCPTEAIRVTDGKARIIEDRCIDCGECIRNCTAKAKKPVTNRLDEFKKYDKVVALVAPSLYGQFPSSISIDRILTAVKSLGCDDVLDVASAAEILSDYGNQVLHESDQPKPVISTSCPVVVRLISIRYPDLIDHLMKVISPMELAARAARKKWGEDAGIFFISPCPAKKTATETPRGMSTSTVNGVISFNEIYLKLSNFLKNSDKEEPLSAATSIGWLWAHSEGEGQSLDQDKWIAIEGIRHVIDGLEKIENGKWSGAGFVEMMACPGGCVGGTLTPVDPFEAKSNLRQRIKSERKVVRENEYLDIMNSLSKDWDGTVDEKSVYQLDSDFEKAVEMMEQQEELIKQLPMIDCGSCGSPSCRALAEDVVRGDSSMTNCVFVLREKIRGLTNEMVSLQNLLPPAIDKRIKKENKE